MDRRRLLVYQPGADAPEDLQATVDDRHGDRIEAVDGRNLADEVRALARAYDRRTLPEESQHLVDPSVGVETVVAFDPHVLHQLAETIETLHPVIVLGEGTLLGKELLEELRGDPEGEDGTDADAQPADQPEESAPETEELHHLGTVDADRALSSPEALFEEFDGVWEALPDPARSYLEEACETFAIDSYAATVEMALKSVEHCVEAAAEARLETPVDDPWTDGVRALEAHADGETPSSAQPVETVEFLARKRAELADRSGVPSEIEAVLVLGLARESIYELHQVGALDAS